MSEWNPGDVIALTAVVASLVGIAVTQLTQLWLFHKRAAQELRLHREQGEVERVNGLRARSVDAANRLLDSVEAMVQIRTRSGTDGPPQTELDGPYRELRLQVLSIHDPSARETLERVATAFYQWDAADELLSVGSHYIFYHCDETARRALGAVLRGEDVPDEGREFVEIFNAQGEVWSWRIEDTKREELQANHDDGSA